jgi:hypothetical protein
MTETCGILTESKDPMKLVDPCGRPAKYKTTIDKTGKDLYLCGTHARIINNQYERQGSDKRCEGYFK